MTDEIVYPSREHKNADRAARRRAEAALNGIEAEVATLRRRLASPEVLLDEDDTQLITSRVRDLTGNFGRLGALREAREWAAADRAQAAEGADAAYERWMAGPAGPAYAGDTDVRDGFRDGYRAALGISGEA
jgi:hypothetical protein